MGGEDENIVLLAIETCDRDHPQPFKVMVITKDVCAHFGEQLLIVVQGIERMWIQESSSLKQRIREVSQSGVTLPKHNQV